MSINGIPCIKITVDAFRENHLGDPTSVPVFDDIDRIVKSQPEKFYVKEIPRPDGRKTDVIIATSKEVA